MLSGKWDEAVAVAQHIQQHNLFLHYDSERGVNLWTPHRKIAMRLRRAVVKHRQQLLTMMHEADSRVCPARDLHRQHFIYKGAGLYQCAMCAQVEPFLPELK